MPRDEPAEEIKEKSRAKSPREAPAQAKAEPPANMKDRSAKVDVEDDCEIGRLRLDCALDNGLSFWICGDQLLKGAALNAVQIAELLVE